MDICDSICINVVYLCSCGCVYTCAGEWAFTCRYMSVRVRNGCWSFSSHIFQSALARDLYIPHV